MITWTEIIEISEEEVRTLAMNRNHPTTLIYLDSGANNHCFANDIDFSTYTVFSILQYGQATMKNSKFCIIGKGIVRKTFSLPNGQTVTVIFHDILYTPKFDTNLVSINYLDEKEYITNMKDGQAIITNKYGITLLVTPWLRKMY